MTDASPTPAVAPEPTPAPTPPATPEQVRFHAAGHLAAAHALLREIEQFLEHPKVNAPEAVVKVAAAVKADLMRLESWFVHPLNGTLEKGG